MDSSSVLTRFPASNSRRWTLRLAWNDTDIVYVLGENLLISGTPVVRFLETVRQDITQVQFIPQSGGTLAADRATTTDWLPSTRFGNEGLPSLPSAKVTTTTNNRSIRLNLLPAAPSDFVVRRLDRSSLTSPGAWDLVAELDKNSASLYR